MRALTFTAHVSVSNRRRLLVVAQLSEPADFDLRAIALQPDDLADLLGGLALGQLFDQRAAPRSLEATELRRGSSSRVKQGQWLDA